MKLTKTQLKKIVLEQLSKVIDESEDKDWKVGDTLEVAIYDGNETEVKKMDTSEFSEKEDPYIPVKALVRIEKVVMSKKDF